MSTNESWARKIISRWDPGYRPRWEVFDAVVRSVQDKNKICLEIGSGTSGVLESTHDFKIKIHSDMRLPPAPPADDIPFLQLNLYTLPFKNSSIDLILLRFIVEHLYDPGSAFREIKRVLNPAGLVVILTTNLDSPLIRLPKVLPYSLRKKLMMWIFKVQEDRVFPTYHRFNRKAVIPNLAPDFQIVRWNYLQDVNWSRKSFFIFFFCWHLFSKWLHLEFLRTNILAILKKNLNLFPEVAGR
jgi:SAM-dependent methyltransferase